MPYPMQIDSDGGVADLDVYWIFYSVQENKTSAEIQAFVGNTASAGSYGYELQIKGFPFTGTYIQPTVTQSTASYIKFNITSLVPGTTYILKVRAYSGSGMTGNYGLTQYTEFTVPKTVTTASILETFHKKEHASEEYDNGTGTIIPSGNEVDELSKKIGAIEAALALNSEKSIERTTKSLFKLSNNSVDPDNYSVAYKTYSSLDTTKTHYAFGTSLFFKANNTDPNQAGGFAFFVDNAGQTGYFIQVSTSANAAVNQSKEFKILKIKGGRMVQLQDSQTVSAKSLGGIFGGKTYKIDVRVKVNTTSVELYCYVNGFKITAVDSNPTGSVDTTDPTPIIPRSNKVAMICNKGTVYFDYIYGLHLTEEQFEQEELFNVYEGQYSEAAISFLYGNKTLQNNTLSNSFTNGFIEEFGAVARELRVLKTKYTSRPAFPLYASTGVNSFARILGQRLTSFGAEVYVINNSGTYIPLDDSEFYSFYILGKYISQSGVLEYVDNSASEYTSQEPVIFESKWIQKNSDVVNLANWIKEIWSNKQKIINIEVFANPLLSVGDIITVTYPYNDLSTSDKFVITNINHDFREGLRTTITARTL
jgi:hypothetical protein